MSLLGRLRAALGRDHAALLLRARADVRMGLALNPPACLAPLNRAIAQLERLPTSPEVALLAGQALRAKAAALTGQAARDLRARSVAKLTAILETPGGAASERAGLWAALAQAWMPLAEEARDPDLTFRLLVRAQQAQIKALVLPSAAAHLAMADITLALCQNPQCPGPKAMAKTVQGHLRAARGFAPGADESQRLDGLESAIAHLFPDVQTDQTP